MPTERDQPASRDLFPQSHSACTLSGFAINVKQSRSIFRQFSDLKRPIRCGIQDSA